MGRLRIRVYIAGPISLGDQTENVRHAGNVGVRLLRRGFAVMIPQLTHLVDPTSVHGTVGYAHWLESDFSFISVCDAVLRLPGESAGADAETAFAASLSIPVFTSVDDLQAHYRGRVV